MLDSVGKFSHFLVIGEELIDENRDLEHVTSRIDHREEDYSRVLGGAST